MGQWPNEIKKFLGDALKVHVVKDMANLNKTTVADIEAADVNIGPHPAEVQSLNKAVPATTKYRQSSNKGFDFEEKS